MYIDGRARVGYPRKICIVWHHLTSPTRVRGRNDPAISPLAARSFWFTVSQQCLRTGRASYARIAVAPIVC